MLVKLVCFILGLICSMAFVIVISRVIISSEESRREENEQLHKEKNNVC